MSFFALLNGTEIVSVLGGAPATDSQYVELSGPVDWAQRPSRNHRPHWIGGTVVWQDHRTLAQAKVERIGALREAREAAINSTFVWDGSVFDADQISQTRLLGVFMASQRPGWPGQAWRLADNTWRTLSAADVAGVWAALELHITSHFAVFAAREAAVNAAGTVAEVDAVQW